LDNTGSIDYEEFLAMVRGPINKARETLVRMAFKKMDVDGNGVLDISDIKSKYNAKMHPDVRSGKVTEDDVLYEFLDTFEQHYALQHPGSKKSKDRVIAPEEFLAYYENVSCSIDNDDYFEAMMVSAWNLDNKAPAKKAWGGQM